MEKEISLVKVFELAAKDSNNKRYLQPLCSGTGFTIEISESSTIVLAESGHIYFLGLTEKVEKEKRDELIKLFDENKEFQDKRDLLSKLRVSILENKFGDNIYK